MSGMAPPSTASRRQYVDDELLRVPLVADQVFDATCDALQRAASGLRTSERAALEDLLAAALPQRARMVEGFVASVQAQVRAERRASGSSAPATALPGARPALRLLGEDEVAADIEIARALEAIRHVAEHELRELATFTSALAGDREVSRDHNPFRPETYARALWAGMQAMDLPVARQVMLMRHALEPLAQVLRKAYAGACARLESRGVEPADYRTVILVESGTAAVRDPPACPDMTALALGHLVDAGVRALPEAHRAAVPPPPGRLDRQFEAMCTNERVAADIRAVFALIQPLVRRAALHGTRAMDNPGYPLWRFMDAVAHLASLHAEGSPAREELLYFVQTLIDAMQGDPAPDVEVHRRALARLLLDDRRRLRARIQQSGDDIAGLQDLEDRWLAAAPARPDGPRAIEASEIDTVPAALLVVLNGPREDVPDAAAWWAACQPGDWMRIFSQGHWQRVQLLWQGRRRELWLFGQEQVGATTALRRQALERLLAEGLLTPLRVRSMWRAATMRVKD